MVEGYCLRDVKSTALAAIAVSLPSGKETGDFWQEAFRVYQEHSTEAAGDDVSH